ncbi:carbohydrate ABC transporter permease [Labedella populi]|uniref:Carbohydrate ABC transporter permease n=1 Tax=Labedella populi TaxID=2498850 RepID=A0A3S3ZTN0_9MICO|nr:carbohydrate ABC transporter permease [Labedella populi]RWZ64426.1 carbohydrate ABC transporter permease [Labedella populi]
MTTTSAPPKTVVTRGRTTEPRRRRSTRSTSVFAVIGVALALVWVFPIYWMLNSSLQTDEQLYGSGLTLFPTDLFTGNFERVIADQSFWRAMGMSATVTALAVVVAVLTAIAAAAAVSRFRFRSRGAVILVILVIQMIPAEAMFISQYRMMDSWDLINSALGLALLYAGHSIPITIWMLKGFIDGVPYELEEAGQVDGLSHFGAFRHITLPLLAPGLVASSIFAFLSSWNEYTLALVIMKDNAFATLPLWLRRFNVSYEATDWGGIMAGSALIAIPVIIVFLIVQGRMATGLVGGAVKG